MQNKKSELMLIRRARSYSSSCSQVILVYFHSPAILSQFTFEVCTAAKNRQKSIKPTILGVQGHRCYTTKSSSPVLAACLCLSATIFALDESIAMK